MARIRFAVHGRVQGVGFRWAARNEAQRLGLAGFVRNRSDGDVEGEADGAPELLQAFRAWLQQGPALAVVRPLEWHDAPAVPREDSFEIRR